MNKFNSKLYGFYRIAFTGKSPGMTTNKSNLYIQPNNLTFRYYSKIAEAVPTPKVLVPISHGSEEIEVVCIIDTLRRAEIEVIVGMVEGKGGDLKD
jgi:hypothetical protein